MTRLMPYILVALALGLLTALAVGLKIDDGTTHARDLPPVDLHPSPVEGANSSYAYVATTQAPVTSTTVPTRKSAPQPQRSVSGAVYPTDDLLDRLAYCETGGTMDPTTNTGNGYFGAFQFDIGTWWSVGGEGYPHEHPYVVQRELARTLILQAGWSRFPSCSRTIGAR